MPKNLGLVIQIHQLLMALRLDAKAKLLETRSNDLHAWTRL